MSPSETTPAPSSYSAVPVFVPQSGSPNAAGDTSPSQRPEIERDRQVVWGVPFDRVTMSQAIDHIDQLIERGDPSYVITANLNYVMLHHQDPSMHTVTEDADLVLADGQPIVWRSKLDEHRLPERVAGSEMIFPLAERCRDRGWSIYFLGGQPGVAAACADRLGQRFPGLKIAGVESPPFRALTDEERLAQQQRIRDSGASLLLVAFGQPKGERWIHSHFTQLGIPVSIQLGASFDFIAGTATRAPLAFQKLGLEWAYRMLTDPRRLVPRYAANAGFLCRALCEDWKRLVTHWGMGSWVDDGLPEPASIRERS